MSIQQQKNTGPLPGQDLPWYRQFWPWFIIALPASVVVASIITYWLAVSQPVQLVVTADEYQRINSELKAQAPVQEKKEDDSDGADSRSE